MLWQFKPRRAKNGYRVRCRFLLLPLLRELADRGFCEKVYQSVERHRRSPFLFGPQTTDKVDAHPILRTTVADSVRRATCGRTLYLSNRAPWMSKSRMIAVR